MYRIVGADQKEYGPVTPEIIRQWIQEGRANGNSIVRFGEGPWKPLSTFQEFAADLGQQPAAPAPSPGPPGQGSPMLVGGPGNHPLAVTGLILSCVSLVPCCCFGPLFSVVGVVLCAIAISQINQEPGRWTGKSLAMAGIILALVSFAVFAIFWMMNGHISIRNGAFQRP